MSLEGDEYEFSKAEVSLDGKIYSGIINVSHSQPLERAASMGTSGSPRRRTRGTQSLGDGSLEWDDFGELDDFLDNLASSDEGFCEKEFTVTVVLRAKGRPNKKITLKRCALLDLEGDYSQGAEAIGGVTPFDFLEREINGKKAIAA